MREKLSLDSKKIDEARAIASSIADGVYSTISGYSTETIERTIVRMLGVDGIDDTGVPLPNVVVSWAKDQGLLGGGIASIMGSLMASKAITPQRAAEIISSGEADSSQCAEETPGWKEAVDRHARETVAKIVANREKRASLIGDVAREETPYLYCIVATGNIHEDVVQAQAAAYQGAQIIAVIRSTAQSLLDYVPHGATTEGFGGTYATRENFRIMRKALDEAGEKLGRYVRLVNYCSGLCMPEIAAMGALERLDMMLNDALYGIIFRDINMLRTFTDQHFSRRINAFANIVINTGEDNYLTTADAFDEAHTVLASQFINEQFAKRAGLAEEQMGLGHAFEMHPLLENGFLFEVAQAQMAREIFPRHPLKYMPPTKFMTGNIFRGHVQDALFMQVSVLTGQTIHLLGMLTEALHTPHIQDRFLSIEAAKYVRTNALYMSEDLLFKENGIMQGRAREVLNKGLALLREVEGKGLFRTLEEGIFAGIKRPRDGGKGRDGVFEKGTGYYNPFDSLLETFGKLPPPLFIEPVLAGKEVCQ
ncbi:MAG: lysine 5,6-aminomutase subunit alpha [Candidatus Eremiobacteraeota bacterium]|nr:lysine 5,6-aminomutase subunit alpha [Candidatus Eremiobacteraeota bacterium]